MKDASFSRTYTIKIHGITGEGDVPRWVHMGLHNTLQDLTKTFKTLHYSISETGEPDTWEYATVEVNASPEPTATSQ